MDTLTDNQLLQRIATDQDRDAFAELVHRHAAMVYRTAHRLTPSEADDVAQAVFLLLWQKHTRATSSISLAAWLHRATVYCCRNAQKMQDRRDHHEREAAMQHTTSTPEPHRPEEILAILDESLHHLTDKCRQAVLLRYIEGLTAQEAAARLGITAHAVAKQAERGVEKIRALLLSRGYSTPAASIVTVLATEATHRTPETLLQVLTQIPQITAGPAATTLAAQTAHALAATKLKTAAVVLTTAILAAGGIGLATGLQASPKPPAIAASKPTPIEATVASEDEKTVPGEPHVYRYEMLIEDGLCQAIVKDATPVPAQGDFQVYRMSSRAVREWLIGAPDSRVFYAFEHGPSLEKPDKAPAQQIGFLNFYMFGSTISYTDPRRGSITAASRGGISGQMWADAAGVHFPFRNNSWRLEISGIAGGQIEKEGTVTLNTTLPPGENILFVLPVGQLHDGQYSYVVAMEVFNATPGQGGWIRDLRTTKDWVRYGPGLSRRIADQIIAWAKAGHLPEETPDRWKRTLSDGTVVTLQAITLPQRWPGISWDADGKPLKGLMTSWDASDGNLRITGQINWTTPPKSMQENGRLWGNTNVDKPSSWSSYPSPGTTAIEGRVAVGPFQNAGTMRKGQPLSVGPFKITPRDIEKGTREWSVSYVVEGPAAQRSDYVLTPVAITRTGQQVGPEHANDELNHWYKRDPGRSNKEMQSAYILRRAGAPFNQDEFDHIELLWRQTELVRFDAFATAPATPLVLDLGKEAQAAKSAPPGKAAAVASAELRQDDVLAEEDRPSAAIQKLLAAMHSGDKQEMRKYLTGDQTACDIFVNGFAARAKLFGAVRQHLGNIQACPVLQNMASFDSYLQPGPFTLRDDGIATAGQLICRPGQHGWQVDLSESFSRQFVTPRDQQLFRQMIPQMQQLTADLDSGKLKTLRDLNDALNRLVEAARQANSEP